MNVWLELQTVSAGNFPGGQGKETMYQGRTGKKDD